VFFDNLQVRFTFKSRERSNLLTTFDGFTLQSRVTRKRGVFSKKNTITRLPCKCQFGGEKLQLGRNSVVAIWPWPLPSRVGEKGVSVLRAWLLQIQHSSSGFFNVVKCSIINVAQFFNQPFLREGTNLKTIGSRNFREPIGGIGFDSYHPGCNTVTVFPVGNWHNHF